MSTQAGLPVPATELGDMTSNRTRSVAIPATPPSKTVEQVKLDNNPMLGDPMKYPLDGVTEAHAKTFWETYNLPIELDVFIRGVLAVRSQEEIEECIRGTAGRPFELTMGNHKYTQLESAVLYNAWTRGRWEIFRNLSRSHCLLIVACIYAAITQGWDQAAMAGAANDAMKGLGRSTEMAPSGKLDPNMDTNTWLLGLLVGAPFFAGAIFGLVLTDPVTSVWGFGRRGAICVAGIFSFLSVIGSASVHIWWHLLIFRILLGVGMAGKASIVPILLSETAPRQIRGLLLVFWQLFVAFGLAAGSVANLSVYQLNEGSSWRYMFIAAFIPALLLVSLILFSPESPRWLLKESGTKKSHEKDSRIALVQAALKSLIDLRGETVPVLAAGELFLMHTRLINEQRRIRDELQRDRKDTSRIKSFEDSIQHINWWTRVESMFFRTGSTRRAHMAAAAVMISQQACGINLIAFLAYDFLRYSIFHQEEEPSSKQKVQILGAACGLMSLSFLATIPALFVIDNNNGRRRALNWSFPCMAISLMASALVLRSAKNDAGDFTPKAIAGHYVFLAMFMVAYSMGEGPAAFVISAEIFPLVNRELGMSLAVYWNFTGAGLLAVLAPKLLSKLGQAGVLLLFAGCNIVAWFLCYWLVPNIAKEDLEAIHEKLEYNTDFKLFFSVRTILRNFGRLLHFCVSLGCFRNDGWEEYGYGPEVKTIEEEWKDYKAKI